MLTFCASFNHERWVMCCGASRTIRLMVEECFKWAHQRIVFGKPLIEQAVIRAKFADMFAKVEAAQATLEHITFQMCNMSYQEQADLLAGPIGSLKMYITTVAGEISSECVNIFGGRGITKGGMGGNIEMFRRTQKVGGGLQPVAMSLTFGSFPQFDAILGGAEEVLGDLSVRQASRKMPRAVL